MVQQIDYLTSSIDLNEEEQQEIRGDSSSSPGSSTGELTVGSILQRPPEPEEQPGPTDSSDSLSRDLHSLQLCSESSRILSDRNRTLRFTRSLGTSSRPGGRYKSNISSSNLTELQNLPFCDSALSPQRSLPIRPPTPGLSPLTVNLGAPSSPGSQHHSPVSSTSIRVSPLSPSSLLSPRLHPPPVLSPSVIIETKVGSYQTPQSDHPSAAALAPSPTQPPSASCPPTDSETQPVLNIDSERQQSSAGSVHGAPQVCAANAATQGRRGRKPPPYPHHRISEHTKKAEPRKAPPYPEKRRLLSTTV